MLSYHHLSKIDFMETVDPSPSDIAECQENEPMKTDTQLVISVCAAPSGYLSDYIENSRPSHISTYRWEAMITSVLLNGAPN